MNTMSDRPAELILYADAAWESPWVFHAMVALEELKLKYKLEPLRRPFPTEIRDQLRAKAVMGLVPALTHGDFGLTESSAISEYLADAFPPPAYPRILPSDVQER